MSDIPEIKASDYRSALHLTNQIAVGEIALPVRVLCGDSGFTITCANQNALSLGVLMAASWPEPKDDE
jgi:hypothetical protein